MMTTRTLNIVSAPAAMLLFGLFAAASALATDTPKAESFGMLDSDGDGYISAREASGSAMLSTQFGSADTDADGRLSEDEYRAATADKMERPHG